MRRPIARDQNQRKRAVSSQVSSWVNFTPRSLPGLQFWLDAADSSTITLSGSSVSQWNDKSGNGINMPQGIAANQPTLVTAGLNGLNVVSFDGNDQLGNQLVSGTVLGRNVSGLTFYYVAAWDALPTTTQVVMLILNNAGTAGRINVNAGTASGKPRFLGRTLDSDAAASVDGATDVSTSFQSYIGVYDYANTDLYLYAKGVLDGSNTSFQTATTTSNTASGFVNVGAQNDSTTAFVGDIAEILIYHSAHTTQERAAVLQYFKRKWGV